MWQGVDRLGGLILDATLAAGLLTGVAALAMVACRQPARRSDLARAGLLGALALLPLMGSGLARHRIEVVGPVRSILRPILAPWPGRFEGCHGTAKPSSPIGPVGPHGRNVRWAPRLLVLLYLAGATAGLAWLSLGWVCSAYLARRSADPSAECREFYEGLPYSGPGPRPVLRLAVRGRRPALLGLFRQTILIPPEMDRPEARDRLRLALLHELAHAEHLDPAFGLAGGLAQTTWFFLPWVWWMRSQSRLDQEFLADLGASQTFGTSRHYASSLVDLADPDPARSPAPPEAETPTAPEIHPGSSLFQRVLMLIRCPYFVEAHPPRWWRWSVCPMAVCATLLASGLTLGGAETPAGRGGGPSVSRSFRLPRLVTPEAPPGPDGWTRPHDLPIPLPERFDLSLELWAEPADLPRTRVVGYRLDSPLGDGPAPDRLSWHRVQIRRNSGRVRLWVDGHSILIDPDSVTSAWLSVQPAPHRPCLFRNIVLTW